MHIQTRLFSAIYCYVYADRFLHIWQNRWERRKKKRNEKDTQLLLYIFGKFIEPFILEVYVCREWICMVNKACTNVFTCASLFFLVESVGGCCCCSLACLFAWSSFHLRSVSNIHAEWVKWVKNDTSISNEVGFYWHVDTFLPFDCAVFPIKPKSAHSLSFPPVRSHIDMAIFSVPLFSLFRSLVRSLFFGADAWTRSHSM